MIATGEPEMVPEITEEMIAAVDDPEVEQLVRELQLHSAMIVPLSARGRTLGAMTYVWAESGRTYTSADLALAQTLAARVALVIDNARLYRDRDHIARTLQHSLLPPEPPTIDGLDLAARYRPAGEGIEAGGDFYDAFDIGDGRVDGRPRGRRREGPRRGRADGHGAPHDPRGGDPGARAGPGPGHGQCGGAPSDDRGAVLHRGRRTPPAARRTR